MNRLIVEAGTTQVVIKTGEKDFKNEEKEQKEKHYLVTPQSFTCT